MNKIYIIKEMTEMDYWDGDYNIPVTTIIQEAELINTIIPANGDAPFYEVVPFYIIDNHNRIREQEPVFSNRRGMHKPTNSIYVNRIYSSEIEALKASHDRNIEIIEIRDKAFKSNRFTSSIIQNDIYGLQEGLIGYRELDTLQESVREYHELEKRLNPNLNGELIDYYTNLLDEQFKRLRESSQTKDKKGRRLVYENKNNNK